MKKIKLEQERQPDGSVWHSPKHHCDKAPCSVGRDICPHLHSDGVTAEGELNWACNKE